MMARAKEVYGELRAQGFNHAQAVALLGNAQQESGIGVKTNPREGAAGLIHWRLDRLARLQAFAAQRGESGIGSLKTQAAFLRHEMDTSERRTSERFRGAHTVEEANAALRPYIRYGDRSEGTRLAYARRYDQDIGGHGLTARPGQPGENGQIDPLGGAARRITSRFGMREHPIHGGRRMHNGVDLAASAGTPVSAMQAGRISGINAHGDVTVTHPDGTTKTYRHIDPRGIVAGQEIAAGQPIGALRAHDPRATGPHLHLEATDAQGRRIDPQGQIEAASRRLNGTVAAPSRPRPMLFGLTGPAQIEAERRRQRIEPPSEANTLSPRYAEPPTTSVDAAGAMGRDGSRRGGRGRGQGPVQVTQHFHGGFDAAETARRAQLEQNRAIRRQQAGALHDVGRLA